MERLTISLNDQLAEQFDVAMHKRGYFNRSEAVRDLIRDLLDTVRSEEHDEGHCTATLSYIYSHQESELASSLTAVQHDHHDLTLSTMHVHIDPDNCLEVAVLSGSIKNVKDFANHIIATRGVRYGKLHLLSVEMAQERYSDDAVRHLHSAALA